MQSASLSQGRWNRLPRGRQRRSGSRSLQMLKPLSDGWLRRSLAPASSMHSRQENTSLHCDVPGIIIEIRWCPARTGVEGNEKADDRAKVAAEEPDTRGEEWLNHLADTSPRVILLTD